ncbi:MAG TPA: MaoC family dehydratase [Pyrinomonadaceae bacterium]|jgi:acyl dehydratase|nr:MaoC family dehydratase [Pyrinomonadaceae bacterium]
MPLTEIESVTGLAGLVGREVAVSDWVEVSQGRIEQFAEATGDHQWIHTDPERAARESPFGAAVAHGFLTLSLLSELARTALAAGGVRLAVNYGLNRVRFVAPVTSGSRIRGRFRLAAFKEVGGGVQAAWRVTVEREGDERICCVAEWLVRYYV